MASFKDIKFKFDEFAGIKTCEFSLSHLTVLSGPNSAGKTYIVYAIYSFLKEMDELLAMPPSSAFFRDLQSEGVASVNLKELYKKLGDESRVSGIFKRMLPRWFSVPHEFFKDASVSVRLPDIDFEKLEVSRQAQIRKEIFLDFSKAAFSGDCVVTLSGPKERVPIQLLHRSVGVVLADILLGDLKVVPFAITSERTGISLFWKELDINKNQLIDKLIENKGKKFDPWDLIYDQTSRYALPITDNIDLARDAENFVKQSSFIADDPQLKDFLREPFFEMVLGKFKYSKDGISFELGRGKKKQVLPIYVASSSTKSLFLLDIFINHIAQSGGILVFDEPELNLHPANQRLMAKLLSRLLHCGISILMTTHSDFLLRELNNRIALGGFSGDKSNFLDSIGMDVRELIKPSDVLGLILSRDRALNVVEMGEYGLDMTSINNAIVGASDLQSRILDFMTPRDLSDARFD